MPGEVLAYTVAHGRDGAPQSGLVVLDTAAGRALARVHEPDLVTDAHVFARLSGSIGYWNVLAAIVVMAIPVTVEAASRARDLAKAQTNAALAGNLNNRPTFRFGHGTTQPRLFC